MTDFHSHVLPGIDDGSGSIGLSLQMLDMWRGQGIARVCATPHFYAEHDSPERFLRRRNEAWQALASAMEKGAGFPSILLGAEVRYFPGISGTSALPELCLEGTRLLLLEMPFARWTDRMLGEVADIRRQGLIPVAAHLERYMGFNSKEQIRRFMDLDILIQCNAEFFLSWRTSRRAMRLLGEERVHFLGSDAHNVTSREPNLGPALQLIEKKLGARALRRLDSMEALLDAEREETPA